MTPREDETGLQLCEPTLALLAEFAAFKAEFAAAGETSLHGFGGMEGEDLAAGVGLCREQAHGRGLPEGWVPATTFWLLRGRSRVVGTSNIRHRLNASLEYEFGHIGLAVRPSQRSRGVGTRLLALTLAAAREMGLTRVLLTCARRNVASAAVIRNNGGVLENEVASSIDGQPVQRYWIDL
ncbi:MAG: hypothetical protein BIFFINMI_00803 [Phycisphaerae bacterium]|nr:hypothetical protein [Phycisphaerae bacterium]